MFIESHDIPEAGVDTDICIIGSGPAALTIAHTLQATQRDIWMLEAGPRHGTEDSQSLYRGKNVGLPYFDLDGCRSRQFGGSSNCWGGFCRLFDAHDFAVRGRIPHSGWPMQWDDLREYFERAHALCQLGPLDYSYAFWAQASRQPPSPFSGPHVAPEIRQKAGFDVAAIERELTASSHTHMCLNASVTELVTDAAGGAVTRVEFRAPSGRCHSVRARLVILAAGGIENARLLLASRSVQPHGIGNDHDLVGRFFMEHIDIEAGFFKPMRPEAFQQQLEWKPAGGVNVRNSLAIAESIRRDEELLRCFFHVGNQTVEHSG